MKKTVWILSIGFVSVVLAACGKSSSSNSNTDSGTGVVQTCSGTSCSTTNVGYYVDNWSTNKTLTISDKNAYTEFLRTAMGVCNQMQYTGGTADCSTWMAGGLDIVMMVPDINNSNNLNITFRAWPQISAYGYYSYQAPGISQFLAGIFGVPTGTTGYYNPMMLNSWTTSVVNNSLGFEARTYGPLYSYGNRSLIQVRVDQGKLGDDSFVVKIGYPNCVQDSSHTCSSPQGVWFAQGTFRRCTTTNCSGGLW